MVYDRGEGTVLLAADVLAFMKTAFFGWYYGSTSRSKSLNNNMSIQDVLTKGSITIFEDNRFRDCFKLYLFLSYVLLLVPNFVEPGLCVRTS